MGTLNDGCGCVNSVCTDAVLSRASLIKCVCVCVCLVPSADVDLARLTSCLCSPAVLERKMSTRQSREELIKKGVLKEVYEKGERTKVKG